MNTHSLSFAGHLSKRLKPLQLHSWYAPASIRDQSEKIEHSGSIHQTPLRPDLKQIYSLERRTFL